jgi:hypothetical protein
MFPAVLTIGAIHGDCVRFSNKRFAALIGIGGLGSHDRSLTLRPRPWHA